ncbi:hypothetical protein OO013_15400 [Mangrovivirga sp. M17]|uniref:DUF2383 domain-containing protein n=1 Tax=Mangrovivirga halotolerans TaxID=2993936 RepID=A0ABT3RUH2_9BACT|nr:hypothetical protein [Mangrovivirga halotolerans]MCX2745263.1 hypothetical protein [Mangrovivirga halotolerans]
MTSKEKSIKEVYSAICHSKTIYEKASEAAHNSSLRKDLKELSQEREEYADRLKKYLDDRGMKVSSSTNFDLDSWYENLEITISDLFVEKNTPTLLKHVIRADEVLDETIGKCRKEVGADSEDGLIEELDAIKAHVNQEIEITKERLTHFSWP